MAVKLRLKRMGTTKRPYYRVVAADSRSPRDGKIIEKVGTYNPIMEPAEIKIDEEVALKWLNNGAQMTDTVRDLFKKAGIVEKFHNQKMKPKTEKKETEKEVKTTKKPAVKKTTKKSVK